MICCPSCKTILLKETSSGRVVMHCSRCILNFDGDEDVDLDDLSLLGANWGYGTDAAASVPEPSTVAMLILGALYLLGYRARK